MISFALRAANKYTHAGRGGIKPVQQGLENGESFQGERESASRHSKTALNVTGGLVMLLEKKGENRNQGPIVGPIASEGLLVAAGGESFIIPGGKMNTVEN